MCFIIQVLNQWNYSISDVAFTSFSNDVCGALLFHSLATISFTGMRDLSVLAVMQILV